MSEKALSEAQRLASKLRGEAERSIVKYSTAHQSAKELERLDAKNKQLNVALDEWMEKTHWVQDTAQVPELGMHRADVLRARIEALDAENKALRERLDAPAAPLVDDEGCLSEELRELITGMTVSVDVSTGEHDAGNRLFGEVTEVMEYDGGSDKHKVVLLVQEPTPNFTAAPAEDVAKGVRRYHFVQRSKFGPWTEVERQTAGSVAFVKESDLSPQAAAKTGDAA